MSIEENVKKQAAGLSAGAAMGALTGIASSSTRMNPYAPQTAIQVGQAAGAALRNGSGVSGAAVAGAAVLTAKAAAITTVAVAAAPFVVGAAVIGGIGYAAYKLWNDD